LEPRGRAGSSSVGIETSLWAGRPGFDSWKGQEISLFSVTSYAMGIRAISFGTKRQGRKADHSPPSTAEVKEGGAIPPLHHISRRRVSKKSKAIPVTGRGGLLGCKMLRISHCLDNRLTVNCKILATCSSTYSPVCTSQKAHSVSIK
jgi:hypothetical protein